MNAVLLIIVYTAIISIEVPGLIKKKLWRELAVFSFLMLVGMIFGFGVALDLPVPNPISALEAVFAPLTKYLDGLLS
ncbi:MAG: hypothetical protein H0Z40_03850 [Desulfotomaculum sp.]|nr:hypothetical protein [Desulfotomaculum sp.]